MPTLKYRYTGHDYIFNFEPRDITAEEWPTLPPQLQSDIAAAPHVYELVTAPDGPATSEPAKES